MAQWVKMGAVLYKHKNPRSDAQHHLKRWAQWCESVIPVLGEVTVETGGSRVPGSQSSKTGEVP